MDQSDPEIDPHAPIPVNTAINAVAYKLRHNVQAENIHAYLEDVIIRRVDEERDELAKLALELEVDPAEPLILAAGRRSGPAGAALAAATVMKRRFSKLCRDRLQFDEDPPEASA